MSSYQLLNFVKIKIPIAHLILVLVLILVLAIGSVPGYLSGKWAWSDLPKVENINQLKNLQQTGLTLPGWETLEHHKVNLGGNQWSLEMITKDDQNPIILLLRPQIYYKDKPEVEWSDINAIEHWKTDSETTLKFTINNYQVNARFFRAWKKTTVAVVQWYAWPGGGDFDPSHWFWLDQLAQLQGKRLPWVAVCLKIPIDPMSKLKSIEPLALSLAQNVQTSLETQAFLKREGTPP